jgi:choline-sulfatase
MPMPTRARSRAGITRCATRVIASCRSASFTFAAAKGDDHGFSEEIVPMHIIDGIGDVKGLIRDRIPTRHGGDKMAKRAGPGESPYTVYDREDRSRAQIWLHEEAAKWRDRPWVLFVSFVAPHFP